jgi:hypothetical protein
MQSGTLTPEIVQRVLLSGPPISQRQSGWCAHTELQPHYDALREFFARLYRNGETWGSLSNLLHCVDKLDQTPRRIEAIRSLLLIAVWLIPEVKETYAAGLPGGASRDLADRVLPFVGPRFLKNGAQSPGRFVVLCAVLHHMWDGEELLRARGSSPHHDGSRG